MVKGDGEMIGIIATEGQTHFEFAPIFAKRSWCDFHIRLPNFTTDCITKEWGFAFMGVNKIWLCSGDTSRSATLFEKPKWMKK